MDSSQTIHPNFNKKVKFSIAIHNTNKILSELISLLLPFQLISLRVLTLMTIKYKTKGVETIY